MEGTNEVSVFEYKVQVMRSRFAEKVAEYEDLVANLVTRNTQLEQELNQFKAKEKDVENEVAEKE